MWQKTSSKIILKHPRLTVVEDQVILPNGHQTDYLRFESNTAAVGIICHVNGKFLVQKEYTYPSNQFVYQFPGGSVLDNEDLKIGVNRELIGRNVAIMPTIPS